ncbi:MAG: acyl-CoA carboxylase subunit beta, partial [Phreatobacter sp.]
MAVIETRIAPTSDAFAANREAMLALLARTGALEERARRASAAAGPRFHERGQLLPRERIGLLLDPGAPFLELCALSGYLMD